VKSIIWVVVLIVLIVGLGAALLVRQKYLKEMKAFGWLPDTPRGREKLGKLDCCSVGVGCRRSGYWFRQHSNIEKIVTSTPLRQNDEPYCRFHFDKPTKLSAGLCSPTRASEHERTSTNFCSSRTSIN
jgi:hypothetical protein